MKSAMDNLQAITQYLESECRVGRVVGPLNIEEFLFVHINCFGVIPKSTPGKWRLIVDMSSPEGNSVNNGIQKPRCSLAHATVYRQELAKKDALKGTAFYLVDDMLTRLYYVYEKSPKKCRQLEKVVADLRQCVEFDDAGVRQLCASGLRWVSHKLNAMKRVLSKFGAYTNHLPALLMDSSVKAVDHAKLQGYLRKRVDTKYLLGCVFSLIFCHFVQYFQK